MSRAAGEEQPGPAPQPTPRAALGPSRRSGAAGAADLGRPTTLLLVRHGRTDATQRVLSGGGVPGPPLNAAGEREAIAVARFLAALPPPGSDSAEDFLVRPSVLITSPVRRAAQTASAAAAALGLDPSGDPGWAEAAHGDWDGLPFTEIARRWPENYRAWHASPGFAAPGGESADQVALRAAAARDALAAAHPGRCVTVVSHVTPICVVLAAALGAGPDAMWRMRIDPASVSVLRIWADGGCEVAAINETAHLRDLRHPGPPAAGLASPLRA